jgi:hypothetical protein
MKKIKVVILILLFFGLYRSFISCNAGKYHMGPHRYDYLIDTFTRNGTFYEVRQCTKGGCSENDTFPNPKFHQ